ncbi:hypothetical protein F5B21DRAFT_493332 [Xylaria acuta]|nr:hypothetical protein F5B21DRAFT_493332 [Xylaria acuta]
MSDSEHNHQGPAVPATDLLAYNAAQLVEFLEKDATRHDGRGGFDVTGLDGVERLSRDQRTELAGKVRAALAQIERKKLSRPLEVDELFTRLRSLADADEQDRSPSRNRSLSLSSVSSASTISTSPTGNEHGRWRNKQDLTHRELIADGGRPVCSVEHLSYLISTPTADPEAVAPWLSDYPDSERGKGDLYGVLAEQFRRWWAFRKSQWANRGLGDSEEGADAFIKAQKRIYEGEVAGIVCSNQFYHSMEQSFRTEWERMPIQRQLPDQGFPAYSAAVKRRLALYRFARPIQLKKDPRQQTEWTDWLEYLSYEQWRLEELSAVVQPSVKKHHQAVDKLVELVEKTRKRYLGKWPVTHAGPTKEPTYVRVSLDTTNMMIYDLVRETSRYTLAEKAARFYKHRVDWIVQEARVMEAEMAQDDIQQEEMSRSNASKKRQRIDEDKEIPLEKQLKRSKQGSGVGIGPDITASKPQLRRSMSI